MTERPTADEAFRETLQRINDAVTAEDMREAYDYAYETADCKDFKASLLVIPILTMLKQVLQRIEDLEQQLRDKQ